MVLWDRACAVLFSLSLMVFVFVFVLRQSLTLSPRSVVARSRLTATSAAQVQAILLTGACHHAWLIFVVLVETGFHHLGQSGLELLT